MTPEETSRALVAASKALEAAAHCVLVPDLASGTIAGDLLLRGIQLAAFARECGCIPKTLGEESGAKR